MNHAMNKIKGFTLIEMLIVVAIIGILTAIAYPSYNDHVVKTRRAEGKVTLNDVAVQLERCFTMNGAYNVNCATAAALQGAGIPSQQFYVVTAAAGAITATTFTITATPLAPQLAQDTRCGSLRLTNAGVKTWTGTEPVGSFGQKECG
jgi:type IV pilus assembly protein PilE